jgi:predicted nucleotidyltransferase
MENPIDPVLLERIIHCVEKDEAVERLYLFGSRARGTATAFSDIDIAIICTNAISVNRVALNKAAIWYDGHVSFTYVLSHEFETDDHPLHVSSSIKKEGILLWQR